MSFDSLTKELHISFREIVERELARFPKRTQDIVKSRFGIQGKGKPMTLEAIGKRYEITRERVRQIVRQVFRDFGAKSTEEIRTAIETLECILRDRGGILPKKDLYTETLKENVFEKGSVNLLLDYSDRFSVLDRDFRLHPSVALSDFDFLTYNQIMQDVITFFEQKKQPLVLDKIFESLQSDRFKNLEKRHFESYLKTNAKLALNPFGDWGLTHWPEVNPKSAREKAYVVLKYIGKPLHFRDIAKHIDIHGLSKNKSTNPQTVHNELIKDNLFSLVNRGVYGLQEWGYESGTVRDIIEEILRDANRPLSRKEIFKAVLKKKSVKATTVLINLNAHFQKVGKERYALQK